MDSIGNGLVGNVRRSIQDNNLEMRVTFDNFDFKMLANIIMKNHKNSDFHWIVQYLCFERIPSSGMDDCKPLVNDIARFENINYLLDEESELKAMKQDFIVLVARVLVEFFPFLSFLKSVIPKHIEHKFSEEMAKKSVIIGLPIVPYNQAKHADVVQYLESLQNFLVQIYAAEDEVPFNGDLPPTEKLQKTEKILKGTFFFRKIQTVKIKLNNLFLQLF